MSSPSVAIRALKEDVRTVIEYSPSEGYESYMRVVYYKLGILSKIDAGGAKGARVVAKIEKPRYIFVTVV